MPPAPAGGSGTGSALRRYPETECVHPATKLGAHEPRKPDAMEQEGRAPVMHFALVHGGWHGAWCWDRLTPELEARGHRVIAIDLPCEDPTATCETYAEVVARALEAQEVEDVVVVGHSLAGLTIPLVAARRPVSRLIYLCALVPIPGCSFVDNWRASRTRCFPNIGRA